MWTTGDAAWRSTSLPIKTTIFEHSFCARNYSEHFLYIDPLNPHNYSMKWNCSVSWLCWWSCKSIYLLNFREFYAKIKKLILLYNLKKKTKKKKTIYCISPRIEIQERQNSSDCRSVIVRGYGRREGLQKNTETFWVDRNVLDHYDHGYTIMYLWKSIILYSLSSWIFLFANYTSTKLGKTTL